MQTYKHNLSHRHLFSCNPGELIPFCNEEILPGDLIDMSVDGLIRFSPLVAPVMHRLKATFYWVFVPTRIVDDTFEDFITGGADGNDTTTPPTISTGTAAKGTIYDYLGVPIVDNLSFGAHSTRAYNATYNSLFRDPDLQQTEVSEDSTDIQYVMWEKDYFTTARPSEQKGTAVTISVGTEADVVGIGVTAGSGGWAAGGTTMNESDGGQTTYTTEHSTNSSNVRIEQGATAGYPNIRADLTTAEGVSINDLREAWAFNEYQENRYKFGSRFVEYCRFLGGNVGDSRLQRPELLGVSSADISVSEVLQTSPDAGTSTVVGELKGHGIAGVRGRRAIKHFGEHGTLLGLMFIRPESVYTNGLHRKFSRVDKEDYYQPEFARIGWQPIRNKEIYAQGTAGGSADDNTFAYTERYREYKEAPNRVSSDFRDVLDTWHLARQFSSLPTLNQAFISTEGTIRNSDIFATTTNDTIYVITNNRLKARRIVAPREPMAFIRY